MRSIIEASVVDLPAPVGPVTSTSPCRRPVKRRITVGMPEVLEGRDLVRDEAQRDRGLALGPEGVAAQPGGLAPGEGEVDLGARRSRLLRG
jgi:hypothetical protein